MGVRSNGHDDETVRKPKLAAMVRDELMADIWSGRFRPGDHLPTEVELMARFGVSRAPIREAMQSLLLLGVVDISPRRGTTVRALPVRSVVDMAILSGIMGQESHVSDVFDFRDVIESATAEMSARNASEAQLRAIQDVLRENEAAVAAGDRVLAQEVDVRFHAAIAEASGNVIFQAVAAALTGLLAELRRTTGGIPGASQASLVEHQEIWEAVHRRDGLAARRATERHIRNSQARYVSAGRPLDRPVGGPPSVERPPGSSDEMGP
ncbi:MAG: FadR/GntR family transcriptional regulator [Chloroflexota bacterium]